MKNVRKVRVFECLKWAGTFADSPVSGQIYSEDYTWGHGQYIMSEVVEGIMRNQFKLLGTIEVDCTPPIVEETPLPKKRRFKLINGKGWAGFAEGKVYDEDHGNLLFEATEGLFADDWQEVFDEDEKIAPPTYPEPIYLSYDDVERGMWYDVREVLPDEGFDGIKMEAGYDGDEIDTLYVKWDSDFGGFIGFYSGEAYEKITKWMLPK